MYILPPTYHITRTPFLPTTPIECTVQYTVESKINNSTEFNQSLNSFQDILLILFISYRILYPRNLNLTTEQHTDREMSKKKRERSKIKQQ